LDQVGGGLLVDFVKETRTNNHLGQIQF
jgi:hypothetical protein